MKPCNATSATELADFTSDAYSFDRYGRKEWILCAKMLLARGFTMIEAEAILRSKWPRWAGDAAAGRESHPIASDLQAMIVRVQGHPAYDVAQLVAETFDDPDEESSPAWTPESARRRRGGTFGT